MKKICIFLTFITCFLTNCKTYKEAKVLENCEYQLQEISNPRLAGIDTNKKNSVSELSFMDLSSLLAAYQQGKLDFKCKLNILTKNPTNKKAALNRMDWKLGIDKLEVAQGTTNQRIEIPANGSSIIPVEVNVNIVETFSGKSAKEIADLIFGLDKSKFKVKVKPYFKVGNKQVAFPSYINVANQL